jgi:glutathione S-transferase
MSGDMCCMSTFGGVALALVGGGRLVPRLPCPARRDLTQALTGICMSQIPAITLLYFDVRGRGQFIRHLLTHRGIAFRDERVVLPGGDRTVWLELRKDRTRTGAFQKLPTLQWGDTLVGETLVIADFLLEKLGDAALLGAERALQHRMLASSAFLDLLTPCISLIWSDVFNPGVDLGKSAQTIRGRLQMHLATVEQTLAEWQWTEQMHTRPVTGADALLWEALDMLERTFAGTLNLQQYPQLARFAQDCPGAATFRKLLQARPLTLTARPGEAKVLEGIHAALQGA